ncbi:hypothetical protein [Labedella populi]|nr:hypothetical protein [Labedella populi]
MKNETTMRWVALAPLAHRHRDVQPVELTTTMHHPLPHDLQLKGQEP